MALIALEGLRVCAGVPGALALKSLHSLTNKGADRYLRGLLANRNSQGHHARHHQGTSGKASPEKGQNKNKITLDKQGKTKPPRPNKTTQRANQNTLKPQARTLSKAQKVLELNSHPNEGLIAYTRVQLCRMRLRTTKECQEISCIGSSYHRMGHPPEQQGAAISALPSNPCRLQRDQGKYICTWIFWHRIQHRRQLPDQCDSLQGWSYRRHEQR